MQSFIVLGIIPGTNIQTDLNFWIGVTVVLILVSQHAHIRAARDSIRTHLALRKIARVIRQYEFSVAS